MLQETIYQRKKVGLLRKGFYFIRTTRAVWSRVQIVNRSRHRIRIFYIGVERRRSRNGRWHTRRLQCVETLPIRAILEARRYNEEVSSF